MTSVHTALTPIERRGDIHFQQAVLAPMVALSGGGEKHMGMNLLERDHELATLHALLGEIMVGHGRIALVGGEAGIGKTTLVEGFLTQAQAGRQQAVRTLRTLWAACEALFTPRPLGPLYDIARQTTSPLRALLDGDAIRTTLFAAVLDELAQSPTVLVVEDIHWADEATLDLIKHLGRRMQQTATLLILTYRDDELLKDHPLRLVLGDLPARDVTRLQLLPLSENAVATLAQQVHRPAGRLHIITGGNPFFLTETLAYDAPGAPRSVSDAVLARTARRSPAAQRLLELVAVVPNRIERWLIEALNAWNEGALDECLAAHMLLLEGQAIAFRHELARQAVEGALSPARRQALNAAILRALLECGAEQTSLARLAHHATAAEDATLVLRFAPEAAREAAARGAHREAMAHYQTALRYADHLELEQRAALLDELSYEAYLTEHMEEAIAYCSAALTLWRALERTEQIGHDLCLLATYSWVVGKHEDFRRFALEALAVLEKAPPGHDLAMAYAVLANVYMNDIDGGDLTQMWGQRAINLAEQIHDAEPMVDAINSIGWSELWRGDAEGWAKLERSLALALEHGLERNVARGYVNLATVLLRVHDYAKAETYLEDGIAYCAEHDLDIGLRNLQVERARARLDQGDWAGAGEDANAILSVPWVSAANRIPALTILGQLRARRGDPGAEAMLDEARDLALATGDIQYIAPMAAARAEWRWLQGDLAGCVMEARVGLQATSHLRLPGYDGALAVWLWRSGAPMESMEAPTNTPALYTAQIAGDWRAAADAWERLGCPWEQALALLDGDEAAQREALAIFERLGATPAAEIARRKLRQAGARGLSRGPYRVARANSQGLTHRQLEVLPLLAEGRSNAEIAERLSTSPRTVEHHVSAVLAKVNAHSRAEAVRRAYELGLLAPTSKIGE
jgi:DNA-binding CsgD family transcriptional regulator